MKKHLRLLIAPILAFVSLITFARSGAWFDEKVSVDADVTGSSITAYFAGGSGVEGDPYLITRGRHMYNLTWLQYKGAFGNFTNPDDIQPEDIVYFKIVNDFDMNDDLQGSAIPPIGTTSNPFCGYIDGNHCSISNIWVSSNPSDWKTKPLQYDESSIGTDIGLFGKLIKGGVEGAYFGGQCKDMYFENLEVTTGRNGNVGLLAGYLDGSLINLGIKNGKISCDGPTKSDYSIIGEKSDRVNWIDQPGEGGGNSDLRINPTEYYNSTNPSYPTTFGDQDYNCLKSPMWDGKPIATMHGSFKSTQYNPSSAIYKYNNTDLQFGNTYGFNGSNATNVTNNRDAIQEPDFWDAVDGRRVFVFDSAPTFPTTKDAKPKNAIWFDPLADGQCIVSFITENMNGTNRFGLYRIKRNETTGVMSTPGTNDIIILEFSKGGGSPLGNYNTCYFEFPVEEGYEYCIGLYNVDKKVSCGFIFLKLAGVGQGAIDEKKKIVVKCDYMEFIPTDRESADNVWDKAYKIHNISWKLVVTAGGSYIHMDAKQSDHYVHYYVTSGITVTPAGDKGLLDSEGNLDTFPTRTRSTS